MKILRVEPSDKSPKMFTLQLDFDSETKRLTGTVGSYLYGDGDLILDVDIDLKDWVGKLVEFRVMMTDRGFELVHFNLLKNYAIANGMPSAPDNRRDMRMRVFRLFVNEDIDSSVIQLLCGHEAIEGFDDIIEDGDIELRMYNLVRRDEQAQYAFKLARLKSDMLGVVDQRDSVSYLEAQVDILTRLFLEMHRDETNPLVDILLKADAQSVLNIKNTVALANEFTQKKAWVRTVQKDYYAEKAKLEAEKEVAA